MIILKFLINLNSDEVIYFARKACKIVAIPPLRRLRVRV